ncbi:transposase [Kitasatospora sp. NBC_00070]|uniref:transposase n=1 Tax=Kitasatospora sp. NBC_00070 TaxID=2975962 RepID=UPI00386027E5
MIRPVVVTHPSIRSGRYWISTGPPTSRSTPLPSTRTASPSTPPRQAVRPGRSAPAFRTYASPLGHTFIDRHLYLPESWTEDRQRCREAGVPDEVTFTTKPHLATAMLERGLVDGVLFSWVVAGYSRDPHLRAYLHRERLPYVLAAAVDPPLDGPPGRPRQPAVKRAGHRLHYASPRDQWEHRSCGEGSKGKWYYDLTAFQTTVTGSPWPGASSSGC